MADRDEILRAMVDATRHHPVAVEQLATEMLDALEARYGEIHAVRVLTCDEWQNEHYRLISACTHAAPF